jgi:hypothetical protein
LATKSRAKASAVGLWLRELVGDVKVRGPDHADSNDGFCAGCIGLGHDLTLRCVPTFEVVADLGEELRFEGPEDYFDLESLRRITTVVVQLIRAQTRSSKTGVQSEV